MPFRKRRKQRNRWILPVAGTMILVVSASWTITRSGAGATQTTTGMDYEILARHPHDPNAYTQGLYFDDGFLIEGTGQYGRSNLRRVQIEDGRVVAQVAIPPRFFGEGIAPVGDRIFQLTWTSGLGFVYDSETFEQVGQFRYPGEGWGLTTNGSALIMSDGSAWLRFLDPDTFNELRRIEVRGPAGPVDELNELEFVNGSVYANVWFSNHILRISPETGEVLDDIDFTDLVTEVRPSDSDAVLNGIAYDSAEDRFFITGKLWPTMFEIRLSPAP
jgi:glutamine cyclotransferase